MLDNRCEEVVVPADRFIRHNVEAQQTRHFTGSPFGLPYGAASVAAEQRAAKLKEEPDFRAIDFEDETQMDFVNEEQID